MRISEVVLDFIQDMEGKIWLLGMKSIKMEDALSMQEISGVLVKFGVSELKLSQDRRGEEDAG